MLILGIETSCDETAAAVVQDGREILSNVVVSQIDIFAKYGGVIPEVAARSHLEVILPVIDKALSDASCTWDDIDAIAVTHAPGLLGSLLIGTLTARTLAILHDKPLYAVHHLKSHVYANWLAKEGVLTDMSFLGPTSSPSTSYAGRPGKSALRAAFSAPSGIYVSEQANREMSLKKTLSATPSFPLLAMVISGGHTQILRMQGHNQFEIVGTTRDDAIGECFDKVAKILGLPYPGGPSIARAAEGELSSFHSGPRPAGPSPRVAGAKSRAAALRNAPNRNDDSLTGNSDRYKLPRPKVPGLDFSFSGLKTAVLRTVQKEVGVAISYPSHKLKDLLTPQQICDFAASFQKTAVDILMEKLEMALKQYPDVQSIVFAGGVSANKELRGRFKIAFSSAGLENSGTSYAGRPGEPSASQTNLSASSGIYVPEFSNHFMLQKKQFSNLPVYFPAPSLSGDNGAMVGAACFYEIESGVEPTDPYTLNIYPRIGVDRD